MKHQPQLSLASWPKLLARNTLAGHLMPQHCCNQRRSIISTICIGLKQKFQPSCGINITIMRVCLKPWVAPLPPPHHVYMTTKGIICPPPSSAPQYLPSQLFTAVLSSKTTPNESFACREISFLPFSCDKLYMLLGDSQKLKQNPVFLCSKSWHYI